jgi:hypothetical protein
MIEITPSRPAKYDIDRQTFDTLPWLLSPDWLQFVKKSCEKVGPLSEVFGSRYHISTSAFQKPKWDISFTDGVTGKEFEFSWDGKGEPIPEEHNQGV